ncbi:MAG: Spy/CpxP family protein refolding chaperone [Burkholderiaceae bacterium]|nr:Spy/CpxP family protein refolding chaperone [Burkholderiaceae bacterium]
MYRTLIHAPRRLLAAAALAGLGTVALAQQSASLAPPAPGAPAAEHRHITPEQWRERMAQRRAEHMAHFKAALGITPDQEGAWNQFTTAMQPPAPPQPAGQRGDWARLTTPERIDRMAQRMAERQQRFKQMGEAIKTFYGQLTPGQQKIFDQRALDFWRHKMHERFERHGHPGAVPHVRHHPLANPQAAASQVN